ncbi:MAG: DUF1292 domain-containing protein [Saccharofermentans sp.]|jgi:hypothetical protein|nr:DUF1292 domain-containing protein [Mageeibacillus sp.]MCI1264784.1 DUF1292 domain-containing protein [Saccharofermentans sp.]MCI1275282.1 DUF1292 domain-containing protein [Saccharofermentans sp.]MCI1769695.1 DUF1292 domain-containing protein [Mageeibacillus sp.]MCI2044344.1 DUF1292 domain-containing protein [Mageeibacillus sp.]
MSDKFENSNDELLDNMLDLDEEDRKITLEDEETGEKIDFILDDTFEFEGKNYCVLLKPTDDPEYDYESIIMETVDKDGDSMLMTIAEEEVDKVYDYYDKLCEELYGDDDEESDE